MPERKIVVPEEWKRLEIDFCQGVIMVIGAPDTGKSTLAAYIFERLLIAQGTVALLDGDPGQSNLGPPTTISLLIHKPGQSDLTAGGVLKRKFIGSTSPSGHMLPMLVGAARLVGGARQAGCGTIVYDTCGLVDAGQGGQMLKYAKFDLLQPSMVLALQKEDELEPLLSGLRRSQRSEVVVLKPSSAVRSRDPARRQAHRSAKFASYFLDAQGVTLDWSKMAIFPAPRFSIYRLVALEDQGGFTLGLGIILDIHRRTRELELLTPLEDLKNVRSLVLGDVAIEPQSYTEQHLGLQ
jgi:polynucleotide 5'-hydroxyl-kinase GRC3/NOL9